ncbi:hypothetical protein [Bradyrhizobium liaoningense]|uniref:hypothetical protein n=1 Tax=Bradyrhizobium liaoningense TaxID=43992 RepID=UPI001BAD0678|nr:hypothetical protein [Bradyrhizobium liaoningense]MBR0706738.1 hypothetical protein [Bradyrhizobium liaoningense]
MALNADDIFLNPALESRVRGQAWALLLLNAADPRMGSLFATQQRWLMAHAAVAQFFRDVAVAGPGSGVLTARVLDLVEHHQIASRNTAAAFVKEMLKYGIVRHVAGSEGKRHRPVEPGPAALDALHQWHLLHLATLDGLDGGSRSATLAARPEVVQRMQPLIADGLLGSHMVREPEPTFKLFTWVDEGGVLMDRLIVGCEEEDASLDRITTDVTSVSALAQRLKLSRTQLGRKLAEAESMGSVGWVGARGKSRLWVSKGFRREYHKAQAVKLAIIDAAFDACFVSHR